MLRIAKILKSNGTEGGLLASAPEYDLETIEGLVFIEFDGLPVPYFIDECTPRGANRYILRLTDISSLQDAEELVGKDIFAESDEEEESLDESFIGWIIYNRDERLGTVVDEADIPGNFCLFVQTENAEEPVMIPLHQDFVLEIDEDALTLRLDLPEGLF